MEASVFYNSHIINCIQLSGYLYQSTLNNRTVKRGHLIFRQLNTGTFNHMTHYLYIKNVLRFRYERVWLDTQNMLLKIMLSTDDAFGILDGFEDKTTTFHNIDL